MKTATTNAPQFVTDAKGRQVGVLLNLTAYQPLLEAQEEPDDIVAYDAARPNVMAELRRGDFMTIQEFMWLYGRRQDREPLPNLRDSNTFSS